MRALLLVGAVGAARGGAAPPVNRDLGVPGYPDCVQTVPRRLLARDADANARTLRCAQRERDHAGQLAVACVGDSITAGAHSSGAAHTYPGQLQTMLDQSHPGQYKVTNLGVYSATMQKCGNKPWWEQPQYEALTAATWDVIIIMLGTNDAKDLEAGHGGGGHCGDGNWERNCTGAGAATCPFSVDYAAMIALARTLGAAPAGPAVYAAIPPPLMQQGSYGMDQAVINSVYPVLIPAIAERNGNVPVVDVFTALGGGPDWAADFPPNCTTASRLASCALFCDAQSCDQCHPNDAGYAAVAAAFKAAIVAPPAPAAAPPPSSDCTFSAHGRGLGGAQVGATLPAATKEACCALCRAAAGCKAAGWRNASSTDGRAITPECHLKDCGPSTCDQPVVGVTSCTPN